MVRKVLCVSALIVTCCAMLPAAQMTAESKGVANGNKTWWQVRYDKDEKNDKSSNAVAIMLKINAVAGSDTLLTGKLRLYRATREDESGNTEYDPDQIDRVNNLEGQIDSNPVENDNRKLQRFTLSGTYMKDGHVHLVTVRGFHYTGKSKGNGSNKNRNDDQLVVRIKDKTEGLLLRSLSDPCDQEPPDEDVLTEEPTNDDANPDDPEYDG